ncbi:hypothetical protein AX16_004702 [Volvariella volvacea WC 439]|nr:hypothetical protein AX16_004702 [Volvariella volvacea WC 439]
MTILVTGGTGNTSAHLSSTKQSTPSSSPLAPERSPPNPPPPPQAFTQSNSTAALGLSPIDRVYTVGPTVLDKLPHVQPFIDLAVGRGVKRFVVLLSATPYAFQKQVGSVDDYAEVLVSFKGEITDGLEEAVLKSNRIHRKDASQELVGGEQGFTDALR